MCNFGGAVRIIYRYVYFPIRRAASIFQSRIENILCRIESSLLYTRNRHIPFLLINSQVSMDLHSNVSPRLYTFRIHRTYLKFGICTSYFDHCFIFSDSSGEIPLDKFFSGIALLKFSVNSLD